MAAIGSASIRPIRVIRGPFPGRPALGPFAAMNGLLRLVAIVWVSPGSMVGLTAGLVGLATGGGMRRVGPTLEFHGGFVKWLLQRAPVPAAAMTLGHVIIGQTPEALDVSREHEWVHVRQYERWGPLFIPVYLGCSLVLWLRGRPAYHGNPFEREAYEHDRRIALGEIDRRAPDTRLA